MNIPSKIDSGLPKQQKKVSKYCNLLLGKEQNIKDLCKGDKKHEPIPSSNLRVEAAACFMTSSGSKEINRGADGFL